MPGQLSGTLQCVRYGERNTTTALGFAWGLRLLHHQGMGASTVSLKAQTGIKREPGCPLKI